MVLSTSAQSPVNDIEVLLRLTESSPVHKQERKLAALVLSAIDLLYRVPDVGHQPPLQSLKPGTLGRLLRASGNYYLPTHICNYADFPLELDDDWLQLLHTSGSSALIVTTNRRFDAEVNVRGHKLLDDCINAFKSNGSLTGLLRWIVGLHPTATQIKRIPEDQLWELAVGESESAFDAVRLLLPKGDLSLAQADTLASCLINTLDASSQPMRLWPGVTGLYQYWNEPWAMKVITAFLDKIPESHDYARRDCIEWLIFHLSSRTSPLQDIKAQEALNFREILAV